MRLGHPDWLPSLAQEGSSDPRSGDGDLAHKSKARRPTGPEESEGQMLCLLTGTQCAILGKAPLKSVWPLGYSVFWRGRGRRASSSAGISLPPAVTADTRNLFFEFLVVLDIPAEDKQPCQRVVQCLKERKVHHAQLCWQGKADVPGYQQHSGRSRLAWRKKNPVMPTVT